ncbi:MAG: Phosphoribosylanthranilate isomerase TrpF [Candidatus Methanohalarchaeum thermophilum]|uniref:N-(5'-phosphoribosyl)anthranilate isomerase n=1 Tax=Methanohalarchaeum thermophilum TaxID=1903181 RepID=A0A1Q6DSA1_METT1|nr:MAG: Phosphoribosylanthranilate isomerase TrpF [Candidatus Methanohalarchaeum thermophilum]
MRIKFCGIQNQKDAKKAEKLGAHAIGVIVKTESNRSIELDKAEEIFKSLGPYTTKVCVTKTTSSDKLKSIEKTSADAIQIYSEPKIRLKKPLIRAVSDKKQLKNISHSKAILLDKSHGKGKKLPITLYKKIMNSINKPVLVSGGINPNNIKEIVDHLNPYGIDVSSGIETSKGTKDTKKMKKILKRGLNL